jgi:hypothetical protein
MPRIFILLACSSSLSALACSNSSTSSAGETPDGGGTDSGCTAYVSDADLTAPTVSFKTDVLPIFQQSCGIAGATCHGDIAGEDAGLQRPFLGLFDGGTVPATVISAIVGVPSNEDPQMNEVTASSAANSFLMHKLDGDQCTLATSCAKGSTIYTTCGANMPQTSLTLLDVSTRDTIRRWIAQGATSN